MFRGFETVGSWNGVIFFDIRLGLVIVFCGVTTAPPPLLTTGTPALVLWSIVREILYVRLRYQHFEVYKRPVI